MGCGSTVRTRDGRGGMILPCGVWDGHGPWVWTLALVGNGTERVGCNTGTRAWELRPDASLTILESFVIGAVSTKF